MILSNTWYFILFLYQLFLAALDIFAQFYLVSNKDTRVLIINKIRSTPLNYSGNRSRSIKSLSNNRVSTFPSQHPKTNTCYLFKPPRSETSASAKHTVQSLQYAYKRPKSLRDANPLLPRRRPDSATRLASLSLWQAVARSRREQNRNLRNCDAHPSPVSIAKTAVTIRPSRGPGHSVVLHHLSFSFSLFVSIPLLISTI